jgi:hypothetical protein
MRASLMIRVLLGLALAAAPVAILMAMELGQEDPFPHEVHEGLFPLCTGCHEGVPDGVNATSYPEPESCASCHDGVEEERIQWEGPTPSVTNVEFDHVEHVREMEADGEAALTCEACHSRPDAERMTVEGAEVASCLGCHAHEADDHVTDADCTQCHVPLTQSGFSRSRIAAIEQPEAHEQDGFRGEVHGESSEGDAARCSTCHTRDRCLDCHVNTALYPIPSIPPAPPDMMLPATEARYDTPDDHASADFEEEHGSFSSAAECTTCHTQEDCTSCHVAPGPPVLAEFTRRADVRAPGAALVRDEPVSHESPFFLRGHEALAGSDESLCQTCHTQETCTACHDAATGNEFHPDNFVTRHPTEAYGQSAECANCHSTQVFCRTCHIGQGLDSSGRLGRGFHDAEPLWLIRHGQAARQTLESCASCHAQSDCVQCHSVTGAFQVNPHGPGFDAARARAKSPRTCFACHITVPGGG